MAVNDFIDLIGQACSSDTYQKTCAGTDRVITCENNAVTINACPADKPTCRNGECYAQSEDPDPTTCQPSEVKCSEDAKGLISCGNDGKWTTVAIACPAETPVCYNGACMAETDVPDPNACNANDVKCSDDAKGLISCGVDGKWAAQATPCPAEMPACYNGACVAETDIPDPNACNANDIKCSDDAKGVIVCGADGKWTESTPCPNDKPFCDQGVCVEKEAPVEPVCTDGAVKCSADGKGLVTCKDGSWANATPCPNATPVCAEKDGANAACVKAPESNACIKNTKKCAATNISPNSYYVCGNDGKWSENQELCPADKPICSGKDGAAECTVAEEAKECENGDIKCDTILGNLSNSYYTCTDGKWSDAATTCPTDTPVCDTEVNGCIAMCKANDAVCVDDKTLQTCSRLGVWNTTICDDNETCDKGACVCKDGAERCQSSVFLTSITHQVCKNGKWEDNACSNNQTCDDATGKCAATCKEGDVRCLDDGSFWMCQRTEFSNATAWQALAQCGNKDACSTNTDALGCKCTVGNGTCVDSTQAKVCQKQSVRINYRNTEYKAWVTETCDTGACVASDDKAVCSCPAGAYRCNGQTLQECKKNAWDDLKTCSPRTPCNTTIRGCAEQCTSGSTCSGNTLLTCQNGVYVAQTCEHGCRINSNIALIQSAECRADESCQNTDTRCSADGKGIETCRNGSWTASACQQEQICVRQNNGQNQRFACQKKNCEPNAISCQNNRIAMCIDNQYQTIATCGQCKDNVCVYD